MPSKSRPRLSFRKSSHPPVYRPKPRAPGPRGAFAPGGVVAVADWPAVELDADDVLDSGPELELGRGPVGRETLAAITDELLGPDPITLPLGDGPETALSAVPSESAVQAAPVTSGPFGVEPGRSSGLPVKATAGEVLERPRKRTRGFSDPPDASSGSAEASAAPVADARNPGEQKANPHPETPRKPTESSQQALDTELDHWARTGAVAPNSGKETDPWEIFEMATFVVRGDLTRLASVTARRDFVAERLLRRLPVTSIEDVHRIDVTPWTVHGTVIVRVWCRV